jgi:hypothetical protein
MKRRVTVDLTEQEYQELLCLKENLERPLAWLGRKAILEFLSKNKPIIQSNSVQHTQEGQL